jgi:hypothetical protein
MKNIETLKDTYRYLMGGYYGIREMDEYNLKEYILKDILNYIDNFFKENPIPDFDFDEEARRVEEELPLITKLQDSLLVLPKVDAPMELVFLVKQRIKKCKEDK